MAPHFHAHLVRAALRAASEAAKEIAARAVGASGAGHGGALSAPGAVELDDVTRSMVDASSDESCAHIVRATLALHAKMNDALRPSRQCFHYVWTLRHVASVCQGVLAQMTPSLAESPFLLARLWRHEASRVYVDPLCSKSHVDVANSVIESVIRHDMLDAPVPDPTSTATTSGPRTPATTDRGSPDDPHGHRRKGGKAGTPSRKPGKAAPSGKDLAAPFEVMGWREVAPDDVVQDPNVWWPLGGDRVEAPGAAATGAEGKALTRGHVAGGLGSLKPALQLLMAQACEESLISKMVRRSRCHGVVHVAITRVECRAEPGHV